MNPSPNAFHGRALGKAKYRYCQISLVKDL
jgi:hypothetical protein